MTDTNEELINTHLRTYRSALRSSKEIEISSLIPTYLKLNPLLHPKAGLQQSDKGTLNYALHRFPKQILETKKIIIGQTYDVFEDEGYRITSNQWQKVKASHRKRLYLFNKKTKTLACFAASISDVDDIVNLTIALQIELQKNLDKKTEFKIKLLRGSWVDFAKTAQNWWKKIIKQTGSKFDLIEKPLIFISSNNHSLINLVDGFCLKHKKQILTEIKDNFPKIQKIINQSKLKNSDYALYYASQFAFQSNKKLLKQKLKNEKKLGIKRIKSEKGLFLEAQLIPGKLVNKKLKNLTILNIEYPLGFAAFHLLEEILENTENLKGVYILGKAATLNTKVGDILIPKIVFDEHTKNTYMINNCFNNNFSDKFKSGSILDNQRLVSVLGTFLENKALFDNYSQKEFNIVEMEGGPYLGAIAQATYPKSLPQNTIIDLHNPPFEIGLIYYSSDSPYILSNTLGKLMGINGVEATYLSTEEILKRIKQLNN